MRLPYLHKLRVKIELKCSNANINYYCKFLDLLYVYKIFTLRYKHLFIKTRLNLK